MEKFTDEALLQGLQQHDERLIEKCYQQLYPYVRQLILQKGGTRDDATRIHQDAFVVLYENVRKASFRLTAQLSSYYYRIALNLWLKELRKQGRYVDTDTETLEEITADAPDTLDSPCAEQIAVLIGQLGENQQELLKQFYYEQRSMKDIAETMGYTDDKNAKSQKYKALNNLKKLVQAAGLHKEDCF